MPSVYDTLYNWARRTTSSFGELRFAISEREEPHEPSGPIYRLKHWPDLPRHHRTADVYRTLSMMSTRPLNRHWILTHSRLRAAQLDSLLGRLVNEGSVEAIDAGKFRSGAAL